MHYLRVVILVFFLKKIAGIIIMQVLVKGRVFSFSRESLLQENTVVYKNLNAASEIISTYCAFYMVTTTYESKQTQWGIYMGQPQNKYSKALRCTFFGERKNTCSSKSCNIRSVLCYTVFKL